LKIKRFSIENFRSHRDAIELKNIKTITSFVGPNNSGKSNIIKAIEFWKKYAHNDPPGRTIDYIFDKKDTKIKLEMDFEFTENERNDIIKFMPKIDHIFANLNLSTTSLFKNVRLTAEWNRTAITNESLSISNDDGTMITILNVIFQGGSQQTNYLGLESLIKGNGIKFTQRDLQQYNSVSTGVGRENGFFLQFGNDFVESLIAEKIRKFFREIKIIPPNRNVSTQLQSKEERYIIPTGENLPQVMNTLQLQEPEQYVEMTKNIKSSIPNIKNITAPVSGSNVTIRISEESRETYSELPELSDGLKQTVVLSFQIQNSIPNSLICIEEPELNLHPTTQKELFKLIKNNPQNNQFFITTHSSLFTGIDTDVDTYLITKPHSVSEIYPITTEDDLKFIKQELGIKNSDIYGYDGIIFVEGYSEEEAIKIIGPALGYDEIGKSIRIVNLKGAGQVPRLRQFLQYLSGSDTKVCLIADSHKEIAKEIPRLKEQGLINDEQCKIWDKNFEDTFSDEQIISAVTTYCKRNGYNFDLNQETLNTERKTRKTFDIIAENFYKNNNRELNKKELAKELGYLMAQDILSNQTHVETLFEKGIKEITVYMKR